MDTSHPDKNKCPNIKYKKKKKREIGENKQIQQVKLD